MIYKYKGGGRRQFRIGGGGGGIANSEDKGGGVVSKYSKPGVVGFSNKRNIKYKIEGEGMSWVFRNGGGGGGGGGGG